MSRNLKIFLKLLWQSILFWTIILGLFGLFRYHGLNEIEGISLSGSFDRMSIGHIVFNHMLIGVLLGIIYAIIDFVFNKIVSKKLSLGFRLFFKTIVYFSVTVVVFTVALRIISDINQLSINNEIGWWHKNKTFWTILIYITLFSLVFSFLNIAMEKFGKGVFLKILFGKYKNPTEEKRVFMFLDLKSSTTIAEELGHLKYSQLIQDCFYDLNEVLRKYEAEIYQYVGDEAVICWPYEKAIINANCVNLFFAFQKQKTSKKDYYSKKYGMVPEFKAGLHGGDLMVAEVGVIKKEIAYHGDIINTSARIQGECNRHNVPILISKDLLKDLKDYDSFSETYIGKVLLKGKHNEVNIYTLVEHD